jgi:hypothetical protein
MIIDIKRWSFSHEPGEVLQVGIGWTWIALGVLPSASPMGKESARAIPSVVCQI